VKQPPDKRSAHGSRWDLRPYPQLQDLWLDDTDKNVASNLPLQLKLQKIWSVDSQENH